MNSWIEAGIANPQLLDEIYKKYAENPNTVDSSWHFAFNDIPRHLSVSSVSHEHLATIDKSSPPDLRVYHLIQAYRTYGHLMAKINPIETHPMGEPRELKLQTLGFSEEELENLFPTCGLLPENMRTLREIIETLKNTYCSKIGVEYMGLQRPELENWLQKQIEPNQFKIDLTIEQKKMILHQLNRSELFELFLHTKFTGQKRFSLEGGETLIPMLEAVVETGSKLKLQEFVLGMAHRGRLNVLSNILNKSYTEIFSEFEEGYIPETIEGSGDVKYHKGFMSEVTVPDGHKVKIILSPNPSHLEAVDPVVEGQVRARQEMLTHHVQNKVLPILVHGDAAVAGQGIVYETMQFYRLPGYGTGGTVHIVVNNQIGFTATPTESRSTGYCTDIAKTFGAPVFHVNAEDPEGCVYATNLAIELRQKFHCDVFIDLNCYRKFGHNESDEPAYTQPLEYQLIRKKKPIRELYRDQLINEGVVEKHIAESLEKEFTHDLNEALKQTRESLEKSKPKLVDRSKKEKKTSSKKTTVSKNVLQEIGEKYSSVPSGFSIHPKLLQLIKERLSMVQDQKKVIDWGMAEILAYGSLLWEGIHIRLSGQDSRRGTFSHRHAAWIDQTTGNPYFPLNHLKEGQGRFDVYNSPLSEYAVLGFEYGYSIANPDALVIWEAQFGDFSNGAQVMIDQFITNGEQKWGQKSSVTLFLPHGYEGQGPEHSSARMERFLALSAENNMFVVDPTTPAQFFHLLRRQALSIQKKPLIVFTPKGLLRLPACTSTLEDLASGQFLEVLDDPTPGKAVKKVVFCTGRIAYDLFAEREKRKAKDIAIVRIEQLYPLDIEKVTQVLKKYSKAQKYIWAQEEPRNMGAWEYIHPQLQSLLPKSAKIEYVGRSRHASPATGSHLLHKKQSAEILEAIFGNFKEEESS